MGLDSLKNALKTRIDPILIDRLFEHYREIRSNYQLRKFGPTELDGGRFAEVIYRIIQNQFNADRSYPPLGTHINDIVGKFRAIESYPSGVLPDSLRRHIPRVLVGVIEVRNNRGGGHTPGEISPSFMDSHLVKTCCDWVMADLIREFAGLPVEEAQREVDGLIEPQIPLVFHLGDIKRVLIPRMPYKEKVLVLLYEHFGEWVEVGELLLWSEHSNPSVFKDSVLVPLHRAKLIEYDRPAERVFTLPPGVKKAEEIIIAYAE